jgi:hypothetical protein
MGVFRWCLLLIVFLSYRNMLICTRSADCMELVILLLDAGADPNNGLVVATCFKRTEVERVLLERGATPGTRRTVSDGMPNWAKRKLRRW